MNLGVERISSASHRGVQRAIRMEILFKAGRINGCISITHNGGVSRAEALT
jgi:hypothetical protein